MRNERERIQNGIEAYTANIEACKDEDRMEILVAKRQELIDLLTVPEFSADDIDRLNKGIEAYNIQITACVLDGDEDRMETLVAKRNDLIEMVAMAIRK